jgi:hypothetical protein
MTESAKRILAVFAESYPESACYRGGRKLRKSGWEKIFPRIESDVSAKSEFLDAVDELLSAGILSAKWKRFREGDEIEALYLENPQAAFDALGIPSPRAVAESMLELMAGPEWPGGRSAGLAEYLEPRLRAGHPVPVKDAVELDDLSRLFALSRKEAAGRPIRALSVKLYADSKRLERLLPVADRLSRAVWGTAISGELGLGRSYPEVGFALRGWIRFAAGGDPWYCDGQILSLPSSSVDSIQTIEFDTRLSMGEPSPGSAVLSIENKETYHILAVGLKRKSPCLPRGTAALVYTAGHPNDAVIGLLSLCASSGARMYHYGDLDPDGMLIVQEIREALAAPVTPWLMTAALHRRYAKFGYALDRTQISRLSQMRPDASPELLGLAEEIAATGLGVEQEIIDLDSQE